MLLPHQQEFIDADDRFVVLLGGRGAGKTYAMCEAIRRHLSAYQGAPEVILAGYEYSWTELIECILDDERAAHPIDVGNAFAWDVPIIDFMPVVSIDHHALWGRRPSFVGVDNMELLACSERQFHDVLDTVMKGGGIFRGTIDPHSKMTNWLHEFLLRDDVRVINSFSVDNPADLLAGE